MAVMPSMPGISDVHHHHIGMQLRAARTASSPVPASATTVRGLVAGTLHGFQQFGRLSWVSRDQLLGRTRLHHPWLASMNSICSWSAFHHTWQEHLGSRQCEKCHRSALTDPFAGRRGDASGARRQP